MVVASRGEPVEVAFRPASNSDLAVLWNLELDLPEDSVLYADGAYVCFELEDLLARDSRIQLMAKYRQSNTRRVRSPSEERRISSRRQIVEIVYALFVRSSVQIQRLQRRGMANQVGSNLSLQRELSYSLEAGLGQGLLQHPIYFRDHLGKGMTLAFDAPVVSVLLR